PFMNRCQVLRATVLAVAFTVVGASRATEEQRTVTQADRVLPADADRSALVAANTTFGLNLYGRVRRGPENAFVSPFSISTALAMTAAGARGETARQMSDILRLPFPADRANKAFAALVASVRPRAEKPAYQLHTANALWGQRGYHFLPDYVATLRDSFQAGFEEVDFLTSTEAARRTINTWVEKQTAGKIQDLIASGFLGPSTRLVLTNA